MSIKSDFENIFKSVEIETAALNRLVIAILKTSNQEQQKLIHHYLESMSLHMVNGFKDDDGKLYNREQLIRQHAQSLLQVASKE